MRYINKPTAVKQYPRARIIFRKGIWHAHIITHPIDTPDEENRIGWSHRNHLPFAHDQSARVVRGARAEQEQP